MEPIGTPCRLQLNLLGNAVAFLQDNAKHLLGAAAVPIRFLLELVKERAFNTDRLPILALTHALALSIHVYIYAEVSNYFKYLHIELLNI